MTQGRSAKRRARAIVRPVAALVCSLLIVGIPLYAQPVGLSAGDWIEVQAPAIPGLSGRYQVTPEGTVDFPIVGPVDVTEVGLDVLQRQLQDALAAKGYERPIDITLQRATAPTPTVSPLTGVHSLQAGDVLTIEVAGEPAISGQYTVDPSGTIILSMVGEIPVTGLTVEEFTGVLTQRLKQYVVEPSVTVNLVSTVPRLVNIVGQVSRPGLYPIEQTPTALALLAAAGGVLPNGDLAAAMLFRDGMPQKLAPEGLLTGDILLAGGPTETADLAQAYILRGTERIDVDLRDVMGDNSTEQDSSSLIALQPDDVIVIPPSTERNPVYVIGAVNAPGPYPSDEAKTVLDLWSLAGPALPSANLHNCTVLRGQQTIPVDIEALVNQGDMSQNIALEPGDRLIVSEILERVYILGQVLRPGAYPIKEGETLMDILGKAGGPTVMADTGKMVLMRRKHTEAAEGEPRRAEVGAKQQAAGGRGQPGQGSPPFGIKGLLRNSPAAAAEGQAAPTERELGSEAPVSLEILAASEWQDVAMRPRPGDVIYIPARREGLTSSDYLRVLLSIVPALLLRR